VADDAVQRRTISAPVQGEIGVATSIEDLQKTDVAVRTKVRLVGVRFLTKSKIVQFKGKGRVATKGQAFYFGDEDGYAVCTVAFDTDAKNVPGNQASGSLVDVTALRARPGMGGVKTWTTGLVLYWSEHTVMRNYMERVHMDDGGWFNYVANVKSTEFITKATLQEQRPASIVSMLLFIVHAEERTTKKLEKFMSVHASDTNGDSIGTVRFWRWAEGDIAMGRAYVVRGLKVKKLYRQWDTAAGR
jgi:hypothetical protein